MLARDVKPDQPAQDDACAYNQHLKIKEAGSQPSDTMIEEAYYQIMPVYNLRFLAYTLTKELKHAMIPHPQYPNNPFLYCHRLATIFDKTVQIEALKKELTTAGFDPMYLLLLQKYLLEFRIKLIELAKSNPTFPQITTLIDNTFTIVDSLYQVVDGFYHELEGAGFIDYLSRQESTLTIAEKKPLEPNLKLTKPTGPHPLRQSEMPVSIRLHDDAAMLDRISISSERKQPPDTGSCPGYRQYNMYANTSTSTTASCTTAPAATRTSTARRTRPELSVNVGPDKSEGIIPRPSTPPPSPTVG